MKTFTSFKSKIIIPVAIALSFLLITFLISVFWLQKNNIEDQMDRRLKSADAFFKFHLENDARMLSGILETMIDNRMLIRALKSKDRRALWAYSGPLFKKISSRHPLTHFYFSDSRRVTLLRVHQPDRFGDRINRFTTLEAERTGRMAYGLELGPLGTLTLRVVCPVFDGGGKIGFIELGEEIDHLAESLRKILLVETSVVIHKTFLDRVNWESGMRMLGRRSIWDQFPDVVLVSSSFKEFPTIFYPLIKEISAKNRIGENKEVSWREKRYQCRLVEIKDVQGKPVGDMLIMVDISQPINDLYSRLKIIAISFLVLSGAIITILFYFINRLEVMVEDRTNELEIKNIKLENEIIERRKIEVALQNAEEKHRRIVENAMEGIYQTGVDRKLLMVNPTFAAMLGYASPEEMIHSVNDVTMDIYANPDDRIRIRGILSRQETIKNLDLQFKRKDGTYRWVSLNLKTVREYQGKIAYFEGMAIDIHERKESEKEQQRLLNEIRLLLDSTGEGIYGTDREGRCTFINSTAVALLGYPADEIVGREIHPLIHGQRKDRSPYPEDECPLHLSLKKGVRQQADDEILWRKDGTCFPIDYIANPVREGRKIKGTVVVFKDITERKDAERLLLQSREELEKANRKLEQAAEAAHKLAAAADQANLAKSEFLANMSHEIRTPMNGVIGMTGLLLESHLDPEQRRYAEIVRTSAESLLELINSILDFSKIEARKLELETLDFNLRTTLEDIVEMMVVKVQEKRLELTCLIEEEVPLRLIGDPGRLRQILVNLIGNGVKFTTSGGVSVWVGIEDENDESVTLHFKVKDTGVGIPKDRMETLFFPFVQGDCSTTRKYGGTGLGLTISKQLVEMMGGNIGLESRENQGTTFWFTAVFKKQSKGKEPLPEVTADLKGFRVLVVEDHPANRLLLATFLKSWDCFCDEAADARSAMTKLRRASENGEPFQAALLDMAMPDMDGEALAVWIKADPVLKHTVLIMITSLGLRGDALRLRKLGFAGFLSKPVRPSHLHDCLALSLGRKSSADESKAQSLITKHTLAESQRARMRILVAEDNPTNQQVALGILKKLGYQGEVVANGAEAIMMLQKISYDAVLMDCQMPMMDGYEATRLIRQPDSGVLNPWVPIMAMTAYAMKGDREKCLEAGMDDYLAKPVQPKKLEDVLDHWLSRKSSAVLEPSGQQSEAPANPFDGREIKAVFNPDELLERLMGDKELSRLVLNGFLEDMPKQISSLRRELKEGNVSGVRRQAHTIKGAAANVSAADLRAAALEMEQAGEAGKLDQAVDLFPRLEKKFEVLKSSLEQIGWV